MAKTKLKERVCITARCGRKDKQLFVYSDGKFTIGICYECGMFHGAGTEPELLEEMIYQPELILDMIGAGQLQPVN